MKTRVFVFIAFVLVFLCLHSTQASAMDGGGDGGNEFGHRIIGLVLNAYTKTPMPDISVFFINTEKNTTDTIYSEHNGNFIFHTDTAYDYTVFAKSGIQISSPKYISGKDLENAPIYSVILMLFSDNRLAFPSSAEITYTKEDTLRGREIMAKALLGDSITYSIMLGEFAYQLNLESDYLSPIKDDLVVENMEDDWYRYLIGSYKEYAKAIAYCEELKRMGYVDAEVVAHSNGGIVRRFASPMPQNGFLPKH